MLKPTDVEAGAGPSRAALAIAIHKAEHQVLDNACIFSDPLALVITGQDPALIRRAAETEGQAKKQGMRFFIAARARFAESLLAERVARHGVRQLVVIGGGLDTFAWRNPQPDRLHVVEVDHPASQGWKRQRLREAGVPTPVTVRFAGCDLQDDCLDKALRSSGADRGRRTFFSWLGVSYYMTRARVLSMLDVIVGWPGGVELALDYNDPPSTFSPQMQEVHAQRAARMEAVGQAFRSDFEPADLHAEMERRGLHVHHDLGALTLARSCLGPPSSWPPPDATPGERGRRILFAASAAAPRA